MSFLKRNPVVKTMSAYLVINALADFNEQVLIKKRTKETYKYGKTARITAVGTFLISPFVFTWIRLAERLLPGRAVRMVVVKVVLDQIFIAPLEISTFYISTNILERKTDVLEEWKQKFWKTYTTGLLFWPLAQTINFSLIPLKYRTCLFMPLCSLTWTTYLCYMKELQIKKLPTDDTNTQTNNKVTDDKEKVNQDKHMKFSMKDLSSDSLNGKYSVQHTTLFTSDNKVGTGKENQVIGSAEPKSPSGICDVHQKDGNIYEENQKHKVNEQNIGTDICRCGTNTPNGCENLAVNNKTKVPLSHKLSYCNFQTDQVPSKEPDASKDILNEVNRDHLKAKDKVTVDEQKMDTEDILDTETVSKDQVNCSKHSQATLSTIKHFIVVSSELQERLNDIEETSALFGHFLA